MGEPLSTRLVVDMQTKSCQVAFESGTQLGDYAGDMWFYTTRLK
jgi:hypothetical protein